jgi:hypothetical protein
MDRSSAAVPVVRNLTYINKEAARNSSCSGEADSELFEGHAQYCARGGIVMSEYVVKLGDNLSDIALKHGFGSWRELYEHPVNSALRSRRPNPNLICPGDRIQIPRAKPGALEFRMAVIDGTGPSDDGKYRTDMKNSFCRQLGTYLEANGKGIYARGPSWLGDEVHQEAIQAAEYLRKQYAGVPGVKLMLAGYSRGGSAAIMVAEILEKEDIAVDSLFLFDAVARHRHSGGEVIPANVAFSRHARRDLQALVVLKYEGTFSDVGGLMNASNPMRPTFGNTGLTWRGSGDHQKAKAFVGSHGALGGVGWGFVNEDPACQLRVAEWMTGHLKARGVAFELKSLPVAPSKPARIRSLLPGLALDAFLLMRHQMNISRAGKLPDR